MTAFASKPYGQRVDALGPDGQPLRAGVFDENAVRAAAGLSLALGSVSFAYEGLAHQGLPMLVVTGIFCIEYGLRVGAGLTAAPIGALAAWMTRRQTPHWGSAKPKRFAWSLGLLFSVLLLAVKLAGLRGAVPLSICGLCLVLMWLEAALGLCLGCEIHGWLRRRGWVQGDPEIEICPHGACALAPQQR